MSKQGSYHYGSCPGYNKGELVGRDQSTSWSASGGSGAFALSLSLFEELVRNLKLLCHPEKNLELTWSSQNTIRSITTKEPPPLPASLMHRLASAAAAAAAASALAAASAATRSSNSARSSVIRACATRGDRFLVRRWGFPDAYKQHKIADDGNYKKKHCAKHHLS